ncbi:MAG: DUF3313 domain-containing protein [Gammaproteobacteria bacterium]|nr:DUF3313 domain-containing protein [Gammaproteobacteria bacterium]MDH5241201.1 DUF3313 domain-containing protein [Gammaproteobacteria bacterium]MDH5260777.1 DUF3313 domain-containing protein [Gammaproteobacteria bacterium]MDH5583269.1 DUF3313 domain-containing protein [Gammaproteobacteria bacterium]
MSIIQERKRLAAALLVASLATLCACTTVETQSFRVSKNASVESAKVAVGADFSQYDRLLVDDMGIFFPKNSTVPEEDIKRIRSIFQKTFTAELAGYEYTREPGPGMLQVQASLVDLRHASYSDLVDFRGDLETLSRPGVLIFLMELRDSGTGEVLGRASDSYANPQFAGNSGETTDWASVETAAKHWAGLFRGFLDANLGGN